MKVAVQYKTDDIKIKLQNIEFPSNLALEFEQMAPSYEDVLKEFKKAARKEKN